MNRYTVCLTAPILIAALLWLTLPPLRPAIDATCGLLLFTMPVMLSSTLLGQLDQLQQRGVYLHHPSTYWRQVLEALGFSAVTVLAVCYRYTTVLGRMAAADNRGDMLLYGVCIVAASGVLAVAAVLGWNEPADADAARPRTGVIRA